MMDPVTLPFGVFGALSSAAAYGVLRFIKDICQGRDVLEGVDPEQVIRVAQKITNMYAKPVSHLHIVP